MSTTPKESVADLSIVENNFSSRKIDQEAYKYWIHCNYCYYKYYTKTLMMYLLSCHHVLCEKCITKESAQKGSLNKMDPTYKCRVCSNIVRARLIGNDMPAHLKELFHPQPWLNNLPTARIFKFQIKHRNHIRTVMNKVETTRRRLETQISEAVQIEKKFENELRRLKHENIKLERRVRPILNAHKERKLEREKQKRAEINLNSAKSSNISQCARTVGIQPIERFTATDSLFGGKFDNTSIWNRTLTSDKKDESITIKGMGQKATPSCVSFVGSASNPSFIL